MRRYDGGVRILLTSDLHGCEPLFFDPAEQRRKIQRLAEEAPHLDADVMIIAGDITDGEREEYRQCLRPFVTFTGPKLVVAGNHDVGFEPPNARPDSLLHAYFAENGFHYLDDRPLVLGSVAFVGNMGWYDGSFPPGGARIRADAQTDAAQAAFDTSALPGVEAQNVQATRQLLARLDSDIRGLPPSVETIVAVTHHVPLLEALDPHHPHAWMQPIMGSQSIGEALLAHPKVSHCLYGHSHERRRFDAGRMLCVNHCLAGQDATWGVIEVPHARR